MRYKISRDTVMTPQLLAKYINLHKKDVSKRNRVLQITVATILQRSEYLTYHEGIGIRISHH